MIDCLLNILENTRRFQPLLGDYNQCYCLGHYGVAAFVTPEEILSLKKSPSVKSGSMKNSSRLLP